MDDLLERARLAVKEELYRRCCEVDGPEPETGLRDTSVIVTVLPCMYVCMNDSMIINRYAVCTYIHMYDHNHYQNIKGMYVCMYV